MLYAHAFGPEDAMVLACVVAAVVLLHVVATLLDWIIGPRQIAQPPHRLASWEIEARKPPERPIVGLGHWPGEPPALT